MPDVHTNQPNDAQRQSGQDKNQGQGQDKRGADRGTRPRADLAKQGEQVIQDARAFAEGLREAGGDMETYLRKQMDERPYTVILSAAAAGFIIGGGLASRTSRLAIGMATRLAMTLAAQQLTSRLAAAGQDMVNQHGGIGEGAD